MENDMSPKDNIEQVPIAASVTAMDGSNDINNTSSSCIH